MSNEHKKLVYIIFTLLLMISLSYVKGYPKMEGVKSNFFYTVIQPAPLNEIYRGKTDQKQVIFTFDGGSGTQSTKQILSTLEKHNIKATFFLTGKWIENNPFLAILIKGGGHEIFSHTYNHPYLTRISDDEIREELRKTNDILFKLLGIHSRPYFRPPYGDRDDRVLRIASSEGYQSVYWTVDALDWRDGENDSSVINRIKNTLTPGNIYLMHLGDNIIGRILDQVISDLNNQGYKIVSLTQGI